MQRLVAAALVAWRAWFAFGEATLDVHLPQLRCGPPCAVTGVEHDQPDRGANHTERLLERCRRHPPNAVIAAVENQAVMRSALATRGLDVLTRHAIGWWHRIDTPAPWPAK
jgi:hypothetical protein